MRAEVVTTAADLAALEPEWAALFGRCRAAPAFAAPAWLLPWWQVFAPGVLRCVAVWHDGRLVALAPLYREDGAFGRRLLPLGIGLSDHTDVLVEPVHAEAAGAALLGALAEVLRDADHWSAEDLAPGAATLRLALPAGWQAVDTAQSPCPVLPLHGDGEAAVPAPQRRKWRMARHRVARRRWSIEPATRGSLAGDLDHLVRLHALRWAGRGEPGVLADAAVQRFHRLAAPDLLAAGLLRLAVLRIDDAVAGVFHGLHHGGTAAAYLGGFDPAFAYESPGTLLLGAAIRQAAAAGADSFSFLRGQEGYKYAWGASDRLNTCRRVTAPR